MIQPIRLFITGPPASGKTTVVEQLCQHFKLHHIRIKDVLEEAIDKRVHFHNGNIFLLILMYT